MSDIQIAGVSVALGDNADDVSSTVWLTEAGYEAGVLHIGDRLALQATAASPEVLRAIAKSAEQLADWREQGGGAR